jgi:hypothetical protein
MAVSIASPVAQFLFLKPVKEAQCYHACHQAGQCEGSQNEIGWEMEFSLASIIAPICMTVARLLCTCSAVFLRYEIDWSRRLAPPSVCCSHLMMSAS